MSLDDDIWGLTEEKSFSLKQGASHIIANKCHVKLHNRFEAERK